MERVDRKTALPAKAATFAEQKKIEDMPGDLEEEGGVLPWNRAKTVTEEQYNRSIAKGGKPTEMNTNRKGESHEDRFCGSQRSGNRKQGL